MAGSAVVTQTMRFTINPWAAELIGLRHQIRDHGILTGLPETVQDDVLLLLSELATNAIEAARPGSPVTIELYRDPASVTVCVENFGPMFLMPNRPELPPSADMRGRGLAIAAALSSSIHSEHRDGRTRVMAVRNIMAGSDAS